MYDLQHDSWRGSITQWGCFFAEVLGKPGGVKCQTVANCREPPKDNRSPFVRFYQDSELKTSEKWSKAKIFFCSFRVKTEAQSKSHHPLIPSFHKNIYGTGDPVPCHNYQRVHQTRSTKARKQHNWPHHTIGRNVTIMMIFAWKYATSLQFMIERRHLIKWRVKPHIRLSLPKLATGQFSYCSWVKACRLDVLHTETSRLELKALDRAELLAHHIGGCDVQKTTGGGFLKDQNSAYITSNSFLPPIFLHRSKRFLDSHFLQHSFTMCVIYAVSQTIWPLTATY